MNVIRIDTNDQMNGEGLRVILWLSGCNHKCPNCHNPKTWNENLGHHLTQGDWEFIQNELKKPYISGITFTGGDPLFPNNREELTDLAKTIKSIFPDKNIWCYTGYEYEEVKDLEIMKYIDTLVDGPFIEELKDKNLEFRGSSNQRIIQLNK